MSKEFWRLHINPILCLDGAATTLLTIQYNLVAGTLGPFVGAREDLKGLLQDIMSFKVIGQFCLTEVGHGLDAFNLETTATILEDGQFDLHTPTQNAAKYMPPTIPVLGLPCVAIVFARLIVKGEHRGIRPFIVPLNDGHNMCHGVEAKLLPSRGGSQRVNHSITSFHHVKLPCTALLETCEPRGTPHEEFLKSIWRVSVGGLALASIAIPALKIAAHIATRYSLRRMVRGATGSLVPVLSFSTQQLPIFTCLAQILVLEACYAHAVKVFVDKKVDQCVRQGVATCVKAIMVQHCQASHLALSERCGAQGLFSYNQFVSQHSEMRGVAIAEGDVLVCSIRLATEILIGRYELPSSPNPDSLLSKHEQGILNENTAVATMYGHRSDTFASRVLPQCQAIVEAIGHRMAYDAALADGIPDSLLQLYACSAIKNDMAWYVENKVLSRSELVGMEGAALEAAKPHLRRWIEELRVDPYVKAPITSDRKWFEFVGKLNVFRGEARGYGGNWARRDAKVARL
ncbi:acyl-CoA dehydrogenase/oxidase [Hysterangium stoloniferum]|nr:acyl-CoA dehydrogenase/oxidase [Hysterangium stoloniferum]